MRMPGRERRCPASGSPPGINAAENIMRNAVNQRRHLSGMLLALSISSALVALTDIAAAGPIGRAVGGLTGGAGIGGGAIGGAIGGGGGLGGGIGGGIGGALG